MGLHFTPKRGMMLGNISIGYVPYGKEIPRRSKSGLIISAKPEICRLRKLKKRDTPIRTTVTFCGDFVSFSLFWTPEDCKGHVIRMLPASRLRLNRLAVGDDVEYWSSSSKCFGKSTTSHL